MSHISTHRAPPPTSENEGILRQLVVPALCLAGALLPGCASAPGRGSLSRESLPAAATLDPQVEAKKREFLISSRRCEDAKVVAHRMGIHDHVYVTRQGEAFVSFSDVSRMTGVGSNLNAIEMTIVHQGSSLQFKMQAFERWKASQVETLKERSLTDVFFGLDGRVVDPKHPSRPIDPVAPFVVSPD